MSSKDRAVKILFATDNFPPQNGGIARFSENICKQLGMRGHSVDVLTLTGKQECFHSEKKPYDIIHCELWKRLSSIPAIFKALALAKNRYDLFFLGSIVSTNALGVYLVSLFLKMPFVVLVHGFDMDYLKSKYFLDRYLLRLYFKKADLILVNSETTGQRAILNGVNSERIQILNPGVDIEQFQKKEPPSDLINNLGLKEKKIILTIARLVKRKGHKYVIEAINPPLL